jgi:hypothetical protein
MVAGVGGAIGSFLLGAAVTSLAVAPFVWFAMWVVAPARARRQVWLIVGGSVGLVAVMLVCAAVLGAVEHDGAVGRSATACSEEERTAFAALAAVPTNGEMGFGRRDGSCGALLAGQGGDASAQESAVADVRGRLAAAGWVPDGPVGDETTYTKDGRTLVVTVVRDGKTTDVNASFPPD